MNLMNLLNLNNTSNYYINTDISDLVNAFTKKHPIYTGTKNKIILKNL